MSKGNCSASPKYKETRSNSSLEYLLFSSVGNRESFYNSINLWTEDNDREYDIVLYYYKSIPQNCEVDYCKYRKGFKFENFLDFQYLSV